MSIELTCYTNERCTGKKDCQTLYMNKTLPQKSILKRALSRRDTFPIVMCSEDHPAVWRYICKS